MNQQQWKREKEPTKFEKSVSGCRLKLYALEYNFRPKLDLPGSEPRLGVRDHTEQWTTQIRDGRGKLRPVEDIEVVTN
ncbi:MAG: hypothetical protein MOB07_07360 [Acidobacteria bacterium]|nr:hypothetical protein [Acidobacteriota bacterium]